MKIKTTDNVCKYCYLIHNVSILTKVKSVEHKKIKAQIRQGHYKDHTSGLLESFAQFNIVILPAKFAEDFHGFCQKNKVCCPLILVSSPGEFWLKPLGDVNIKTDVPAYWVYENGKKTREYNDISEIWQDDFVTFVVGCSFTFEHSLRAADIPLLHVEQGKNVAMYNTNIPLKPVGCFSGDMVVSMRWIDKNQVEDVVAITAQYPDFHGAPVHIGSAKEIGINDIQSPDYGDYVAPINDDMLPVFWGCGVSTQVALEQSKLELAIAHKPGCMLIGDISHKNILEKNYEPQK